MFAKYFILPILLVVMFIVNVSAATVSLDSLLEEMTDRAGLASFPQPSYTCLQSSSYDRNSKAPDQPGWFANNDRSFFVRSETNNGREEWVMMDDKGPGAIVRWWVTSGKYLGMIRIYLDGSNEPVITSRVDDLVGGPALAGPPLSAPRARGRNFYLPIPYAKSCKVTFDRPNFHVSQNRDDLLYYQLNYRSYAPGTKVKSFTQADLTTAKDKIAKLQKTLLKPCSVMPADVETQSVPETTIGAGEEVEITFNGPAAVCRMTGRLEADDMSQALRSTVLEMEFDGERTVWCPLSDFFGSGVGVNPYKGWYRKVEKNGQMTCWWVMPYKESCTLRVKNLGKQPVTAVDVSIDTCPWDWDDRSMYFHTTWRQQRYMAAQHGIETAFDWNFLSAEGKGVFVGDSLALVNRIVSWWGEGDEKIYVDGESFPSHFGTGTEDYYGYAWCTPLFFESPFHAQPRAEGPRNYGNTTNTRVRLLDAIPFNKSFHFDMEVWSSYKTRLDYAATSYWYARPEAIVNHGPAQVEATRPVKYKTPNIFAGFAISGKPPGSARVQKMNKFGAEKWENGDQLWWTGAKPGNRLEVVFYREDGKYQLQAKMTKAPNYAIVQFYLNGKKVGKPVDLYHPTVEPTGPVTIGTVDLRNSKQYLAVKIVGANSKAKKDYMFGLDKIILKPVP